MRVTFFSHRGKGLFLLAEQSRVTPFLGKGIKREQRAKSTEVKGDVKVRDRLFSVTPSNPWSVLRRRIPVMIGGGMGWDLRMALLVLLRFFFLCSLRIWLHLLTGRGAFLGNSRVNSQHLEMSDEHKQTRDQLLLLLLIINEALSSVSFLTRPLQVGRGWIGRTVRIPAGSLRDWAPGQREEAKAKGQCS